MAKLPKRILKNNTLSGQALLIVLLGMAVVLTMVLSVVSRSVTDIQLTTRDDEALRAFSAAEAGVEQALIVGTNIGDTPLSDSGSSFSVNVEELGTGVDSKYAYPEEIYSGESATLWLASHDGEGNLSCTDGTCYKEDYFQVCWGEDGTERDNNAPALEVSVYYDKNPSSIPFATGVSPNYGDVQVARVTYDPTSDRQDINNFQGGAGNGTNCNFGEKQMAFVVSFNVANALPAGCSAQDGCLLFAKAKLIYNDNEPHPVGFLAPNLATFPSQGVRIESTGQFGDSTRQIDVFRTYSEPLSIFESAVFSMGDNADLTK